MKNVINLLGRVGQDPESKQVNDTSVVKFSLATSEKWKDKQGNKQENTEWHALEAWGKLAEVIQQYVKKGDLLDIEGKLIYSKWETENGEKRERAVVKVKEMLMIPTGKNENNPF